MPSSSPPLAHPSAAPARDHSWTSTRSSSRRSRLVPCVERSGIATSDIDDIVVAESLQGGGVIARNVAVRLGLTSVPGLADNRHCAAGLSAVQIASAGILAGMDHVVVAGGTESLSTSPQSSKPAERGGAAAPWMSPSHPETPDAPTWDMSITVGENTAREMGLTRAGRRRVGAVQHRERAPVDRRGRVRGRDRARAGHGSRRRAAHVLGRRAPAARVVDGVARRAAGAPPRDRGFHRHRRERGGAQRRRGRGGRHVERLRRPHTA